MFTAHMVNMLCLYGTLYVLGGFDQTKKNPEHSVDCYKQGKQIVKTTIPVKEDGKNEQAFKGVIVKKSSPKNLSADCQSTVGQQLTDRLPTVYRQLTNRLPTG